jgi:hypothetical protein
MIGPVDARPDAWEAGFEAYSQARSEGMSREDAGKEGDLAAAAVLKCAVPEVEKILRLR